MKATLSIVCFLLSASLGAASDNDSRTQSLVGLWTEVNQMRHAVVLRRADGTFLEKFAFYDLSNPVENLQGSGRWRVRGNRYLLRFEHASTSAKFTKRDGWIGLKITRVAKEIFQYDSSDNFAVEEIRVGGASDQEFAHTPIPPFPAELDAPRSGEVKKATAVTH